MNGISTANFRLQQSCFPSPQKTRALGFKGEWKRQEPDPWSGDHPKSSSENSIANYQKKVLAKLTDISDSLKELNASLKPSNKNAGTERVVLDMENSRGRTNPIRKQLDDNCWG